MDLSPKQAQVKLATMALLLLNKEKQGTVNNLFVVLPEDINSKEVVAQQKSKQWKRNFLNHLVERGLLLKHEGHENYYYVKNEIALQNIVDRLEDDDFEANEKSSRDHFILRHDLKTVKQLLWPSDFGKLEWDEDGSIIEKEESEDQTDENEDQTEPETEENELVSALRLISNQFSSNTIALQAIVTEIEEIKKGMLLFSDALVNAIDNMEKRSDVMDQQIQKLTDTNTNTLHIMDRISKEMNDSKRLILQDTATRIVELHSKGKSLINQLSSQLSREEETFKTLNELVEPDKVPNGK